MDSDFLCIVCKLKLEGKPIPTYSVHQLGETTKDESQLNWGHRKPKYKNGTKIKKDDSSEQSNKDDKGEHKTPNKTKKS